MHLFFFRNLFYTRPDKIHFLHSQNNFQVQYSFHEDSSTSNCRLLKPAAVRDHYANPCRLYIISSLNLVIPSSYPSIQGHSMLPIVPWMPHRTCHLQWPSPSPMPLNPIIVSHSICHMALRPVFILS